MIKIKSSHKETGNRPNTDCWFIHINFEFEFIQNVNKSKSEISQIKIQRLSFVSQNGTESCSHKYVNMHTFS
jgi:hypothetical protein